MHQYEASSPRMTLALGAIAMTAITLGLLVIVPAEMDAYDSARMPNVPDIITAASASVAAPASSVDDPRASSVDDPRACRAVKPRREK